MSITVDAETLAAARRASKCDLPSLISNLADDTRPGGKAVVAPSIVSSRDGFREASIEAIITSRPEPPAGRPRVGTRRRAIADASSRTDVLRRYERIIAGNELTDINYLARGLVAARSVGRVVIRDEGRVVGYGTGFLVAPGVLMTNRHVLTSVRIVEGSSVQFGYELDIDGTELQAKEFSLLTDPAPIIERELDLALVAVESTSRTGHELDSFGWLHLDPTPGKGVIGEYLTIIQHPGGERKQVCVRENKLLRYDANGPYLHYQTDTVGGSSGSPVFNNHWNVVGLHHSGVPRVRIDGDHTIPLTRDGSDWEPSMGDDAIDWYANEGIRISRVIAYLDSVHSQHRIGRAVLDAPPPTVPIEGTSSTEPPAPSDRRSPAPPTWPGDRIERRRDIFVIDEAARADLDDLAQRNGYNPSFLGDDGLRVKLPKVTGDRKREIHTVGGTTELRYWNYSVVMNQVRRLAFFSAANADPLQSDVKRPGNPWIPDPRIPKSGQVTGDFYSQQSTFEIDRSENPFDQGHLSSSEDLLWGDSDALALRNGLDSFIYPNCVPQYWTFNQHRVWRKLERAASDLSGAQRFCVFNGPIFDGPESKVNKDTGEFTLNLNGPSRSDPVFGGVQIPKLFFKVIAWEQDDGLRSAGFVVSHEPGLSTVDRLGWAERAARFESADVDAVMLYLTPLEQITALTDIDFGAKLRAAQQDLGNEAFGPAANRPIRTVEDLRLAF